MTGTLPTLTDVKAQLNITTTDYDGDLTHYLAAAQSIVEDYTGPLSVNTYSEYVESHRFTLMLSNTPIVSITSLVPSLLGPGFLGADLGFNAQSGTAWRLDGGSLAGRWTVNYTAGTSDIPEVARLAILLVVQDLWESRRGAARRPGQGGVDPVQGADVGFTTRRRVRELIGGEFVTGIA